MAIAIRSRAVPEIIWEREETGRRVRRRRILAAVDELLTQLEECNLRHAGEVPDTLRAAVARIGIPAASHLDAPDLIEALFLLQERFMLQQLSPGPAQAATSIAV